MDPIQPIAPDRSVPRVELTYLTPLEREREKQRRERERERRRRAETTSPAAAEAPRDAAPASPEASSSRGAEPNPGIDVRA